MVALWKLLNAATEVLLDGKLVPGAADSTAFLYLPTAEGETAINTDELVTLETDGRAYVMPYGGTYSERVYLEFRVCRPLTLEDL